MEFYLLKHIVAEKDGKCIKYLETERRRNIWASVCHGKCLRVLKSSLCTNVVLNLNNL